MTEHAQDVNEALRKCLQVIGEGNFATSGLLPNAINPGLFVHGVGKVGLPLTDRDAEALTAAAHRAPFGKGTQTFVDSAVRKTWELNPDQFELRNPAWRTTLQDAVSRVAKDLAVVGGSSAVRPELHKLLLYEPGAFFDKHKDTEKAPGMFSTLVIALPSEHTGGDVIVQHGDATHTLQTQGLCDYDYSYLAWYADVNHSVSKVATGYRLVLTYNLVQQNALTGHIPSMLDDHKQNLNGALALWDRELRDCESGTAAYGTYERLVYILDHEYSEANISMNQLKGKDQLRMRYLSEACHDKGFCLYFAHLQFSRLGSVDENEDNPYWAAGADIHEFIEEIESSWKLKTIFAPDGQILAKGIRLDEEDADETIINRPDFEDLDPDDEECDGWTGNEGCTATHFYYRTCAVVVPRLYRLDFLSEAESLKVQVYIKALFSERNDRNTEGKANEELKDLCAAVIDAKKNPEKPRAKPTERYLNSGPPWQSEEPPLFKPLSRVSDAGLGAIAHAALTLNLPEIADAAAGAVKKSLPTSLFSNVGKYLAEAGPTTAWPRCSMQFGDREKAVRCFLDPFAESGNVSTAIVEDIRLHLNTCLVQPTKSGKLVVAAEDAKTFLQLSEVYGDNFTHRILLPLARKNVNNIGFIFPLLHEVSCQSNLLSEGTRRSIFKDILVDLIPMIPSKCQSNVQDQQREGITKRRRFDFDEDRDDHKQQPSEEQTAETITSEQLSTLFLQCEAIGLHTEVDSLCEVIIKLASSASVTNLETLLVPILDQISKLSSSSINGLDHFGNLFRSVISTYIQNFVRTPPNGLDTWQCLPRGCEVGCYMCKELDEFLADPYKTKETFHKVEQIRKHMERQLRRSSCKAWTSKDTRPYNLVVEKTEEERKEGLKAWRNRLN
ncbi:MAG: hypothetical protein Q9168_002332 [Polycauliona sp. 1 TL-2023]